MSDPTVRRQFLNTAMRGGIAVGWSSVFSRFPAVSAAEAVVDSGRVSFRNGIEPLVHLLEETPQEILLESVAKKIRGGTSYREILTALFLAGVRNVRPRPSVGFKFHTVLVVNAAHLASLSAPDSDRWLPIFWALDYFKTEQRKEQSVSGWKMKAVDESAVPVASRARAAFMEAMNTWNPRAADVSIASLARTASANEVFELLYRYGARDYRSIGHKAIFVANSWRTLQCIGWQHAEPVLRSLVDALLNHGNDPNPATSDLAADQPWRRNIEISKTIRDTWRDGTLNTTATREMLATLRNDTPDDTANLAVDMLNRGISPQSVWDAVFVGAGELLMQQPGIIGLHALTTANALHYAFQVTGDDTTRRMLLLQNCAFLPMFRQSAARRGEISDRTIDALKPVDIPGETPQAAIEDIFAEVSKNRVLAASKVQRFMGAGGDARQMINAARRLIFLKGRGAHDYKFSSAVLEDYYHVSSEWRSLFFALSVYGLRGSRDPGNQLVERTRNAFRA